jgi:hypothetical protein
MENIYNIHLGLAVANIWSISLISSFILLSYSNTILFEIGPSDRILFAGLKINTWDKWKCVMLFSRLSQVMNSIISATLNPYVSNVIKDHKTINKGSFIVAHFIVQSRAIFHWLNEIGNIYLWITMQIQFILPAIIIDLIIRIFTTERYIRTQHNNNIL